MKKRLMLSLAACAVLSSTSAAAQNLPSWFYERKIIGNNDLEPIEATVGSDVYEKAKVVARVETADGSGFCTGSRVGEDLFLTNYHCWEVAPCENIQFHLGYERDLASDQHEYFRCVEVLSKVESFDYALYRVAKVVDPTGPSQTFDFNDLSLAIPDNDQNGASVELPVDLQEVIRDIRVRLKVTHTYIGDLQIKLISPEGVEATLHNRTGGGRSGLDVTIGSSSLSALIGKNAGGTWKLEARDIGSGDFGQVDSLSIEIFYGEADTIEDVTEAAYPVATLWAGDISVDQPLLVASHPAARLKEVDRSEMCKIRTIETEELSGRVSITHTCDTEGGSSGSPVLDRETGYVVALHWGGTTDYNLAIPMKLVVEHIEQNISATQFSKLRIQR